MSIKVYDGMRLVEQDVFAGAQAVRSVLEQEFFKQFRQLLSEAEAYSGSGSPTWGEAFVLPDGFEDRPFGGRFQIRRDLYALVDFLSRSETSAFSPFAIGYTAAFMANNTGGPPLLLVFGEAAARYRSMLKQAGVAEDYPYWNNAEEDEAATEEEWVERAKAWAVIADAAPSEIGLFISTPSSIATFVNSASRR